MANPKSSIKPFLSLIASTKIPKVALIFGLILISSFNLKTKDKYI